MVHCFQGIETLELFFKLQAECQNVLCSPLVNAVEWNEFVEWRYSMSSADASHSFVKNSLFFRPQNK